MGSWKSETDWEGPAGCLYILAECCKMQGKIEEVHRLECLDLHTMMLGRGHRLTIKAMEVCARCFVSSCQFHKAEMLYEEIVVQREVRLGVAHENTINARECLGVCLTRQGKNAEALEARAKSL
jgi:hypothetical protein